MINTPHLYDMYTSKQLIPKAIANQKIKRTEI